MSADADDDAGVRVGGSISLASQQGSEAGTGDADPDGRAADGTDSGDVDLSDPAADPNLTDDPAAPDAAAPPGDPADDTARPPGGSPPPPPDTPTTVPPTAVDLPIDEVAVPSTAEPTADGCGEPIGFAAGNLIDRADDTAWRMDGDGTGSSLTFTLEGPRRVLSVGLVPGFDQVDRCDGTDRFAQNRRVIDVTWEFDDGQRISQRLVDVATMQRVEVDAATRTIVLHIEGVTADPERDFTAISEVAVRGA